MNTARTNTSRSRRPGRAFTLAELLVALGIIMLSMTIMLPVLRGLFVGSADLEAIAAMGGMLSDARGLAIESQSAALLHVQPGVDNSGWASAMKYDPAVQKFIAAPGFSPQKIPGGYIFGQVTAPYVDFATSAFASAALASAQQVTDFLTFNVVFSADGALVTQVNGAAPVIETTGANALAFTGAARVKIWDAPPALGAPTLNEPGIKVMVPVPYMQFKLNETDRYKLVNDEKRFQVINPYTGQLLSEE